MFGEQLNRIYCGPAPLPDEIWARLNLDPLLLLGLALLAWAVGRDRRGLAAVAVLLLVFVSPLCALSSALFSARVLHHLLLVVVVAPLLAHMRPARATASPVLPLVLSSVLLWLWHWPPAYDAALRHVGMYWLMQATLLGSALWFWRTVLAPQRSLVDALGFIVAAFMQMGLLGALLTFAPAPLYSAHALAPLAWGLSPLADQQLGGVLMWVPAGLPYAVLAVIVARRGWSRLPGAA